MKSLFCILFLTGMCYQSISQTETAIRNHYTEVNKQIKESMGKGFEGSLYNNHWETNKHMKSWPAVGLYTETLDFWYDDDPNHLPASERNPRNVLLKVTITRKSSHLTVNEEFLFKDGKLWFYYSSEGEEGNAWETRIYFNNKGADFKTLVKANGKELTNKDFQKNENKDLKPIVANISAQAKKYQELFVNNMQ